jgi:hypothetical protein
MARAAEVLARVDADLRAGHADAAARRLRALLAATPHNVDVYRRLAAVYRQAGNLAEAGRWGFVTAEVTPEELAAFERAHPSPWLRLRLLNWTVRPRRVPDRAARKRLRALRASARRAGPPESYGGPWHTGPRYARFTCGFVAVVLLVFTVLATVGLARLLLML